MDVIRVVDRSAEKEVGVLYRPQLRRQTHSENKVANVLKLFYRWATAIGVGKQIEQRWQHYRKIQ